MIISFKMVCNDLTEEIHHHEHDWRACGTYAQAVLDTDGLRNDSVEIVRGCIERENEMSDSLARI